MDRQPATWDDAVNAVAVIDHRHDGRIVADAVHAAGYLVPGRLAGGVDDQDRRRQFAACLVRDGLALLLLAGGGPRDVVDAVFLLHLYRSPGEDPRAVGDRAAAHAAGCASDQDAAATVALDVTAAATAVLDVPAAGPDYVTAPVDGSALAARTYPAAAGRLVPAGADRHA
jgi:hypothetical protein